MRAHGTAAKLAAAELRPHLDLGERLQEVLSVCGMHTTEPVAVVGADGAVHEHVAGILLYAKSVYGCQMTASARSPVMVTHAEAEHIIKIACSCCSRW